jgi:hypothetical protein
VDIEYDEKGKPITRDAATYVEQNVQIEITRDGDEEKKNAIKAELSEAQRCAPPVTAFSLSVVVFLDAHLLNRIDVQKAERPASVAYPLYHFRTTDFPRSRSRRKRSQEG